MTVQITVRLPEEQIEFLDGEVSSGRATSRAAAIARALRREERRRRAEDDLRTLLGNEEDPDLASLHDWATHRKYPAID